MISVLDSRLRGLGSIPWQALWVSATYQGSLVKCLRGGGGTLQCTSIPSREEGGNGDTSSHFMLQKPGKALAGWATWLEYKPSFFSSTYTLYIHNFVTSFWHEPYIRRISNILPPCPKESSAMSYRCELMQLDCFFNQLFMCYLYTDLINSLHCKIKSHELTDRSKASLTSNMNKGKHYKSVIQCIAGRKLLNSDFCS